MFGYFLRSLRHPVLLHSYNGIHTKKDLRQIQDEIRTYRTIPFNYPNVPLKEYVFK